MQIYMHLVKRKFWHSKVKQAWEERPILWLTGVRRVGKKTLAQSIKNTVYYDCELP